MKAKVIKVVEDIPLLLPVYRRMFKLYGAALTRIKIATIPSDVESLHSYWRYPWDGVNLPQGYSYPIERSKFLLDIVKRYAPPSSSILEIGCNVGRNLNYLYMNGFNHLSGVEISQNAVELLKRVIRR